jgi:BlaI family transcriptional regulator, penicillinase repressor
MKKVPRITEAEWMVMKAIWLNSPCSAQEVIERLAKTSDWTPATIKTLLNRLVRKEALEFEKEGKAYRYTPAYDEEQFKAAEADSFIARIFDGSLTPMLAHFVRSRKLSAGELSELEQILKSKKKP